MRDKVIDILDRVAKDVPGQLPLGELYTLYVATLLTAHLPGDILEIGSWCGRSAVALGLAAEASGASKVHCIDLFPDLDDWKQNADASWFFETVMIDGSTYTAHKEKTVSPDHFSSTIRPAYEQHEHLIDFFNANIGGYGLCGTVIPHKGTSASVLGSFYMRRDLSIRLAFIDGGHTFDEVYEDIKYVNPFLVKGGLIFFDDAFCWFEGVDRAITQLIIENPNYEICSSMTERLFMARKK